MDNTYMWTIGVRQKRETSNLFSWPCCSRCVNRLKIWTS